MNAANVLMLAVLGFATAAVAGIDVALVVHLVHQLDHALASLGGAS